MFFKKYFLFYLPNLNTFEIIKAKDESEAVWRLINNHVLHVEDVDNYEIIKNVIQCNHKWYSNLL
jgi:hypothetical protein